MSVSDPDEEAVCRQDVERILRESALRVGVYVPQCDEDGNYLPTQHHGSTGYTWCVDRHGRQINATLTAPGHTPPDCPPHTCN